MRRIVTHAIRIFVVYYFFLVPGMGAWAQVVSKGNRQALLYGVYEVLLTGEQLTDQPFQPGFARVIFSRPDGSEVGVDAFYDGGSSYKARAYCGILGDWSWRCISEDKAMDGKRGAFRVIESTLPGKLRIYAEDRHQFVYDNGEWFLHIGETGYRYLTSTEKKWKPYIDQAVRMGASKIRTWFCQGRHDVQVLFADGRRSLNLGYWQEMDKRLAFALEQFPRIQFQLIPYGEDTEELKRYALDDDMAKLIAQYSQARYSAYPNIHWCISNDRQIIEKGEETGRKIRSAKIHKIARDMRMREPWGSLITNHQSRFSGYHFTDAEWSDITTLEDLDQVAGELILQYRDKADVPVVLDEDRYETYREPEHPRYFFRRLMWASLLSGGHATYGGYRTYEAHRVGEIPKDTVDIRGIQGYYDGTANLTGADDFIHIHRFFRDAQITLIGLIPDDGYAGDDPSLFKCMRDENVCLIYLANPDHPDPGNARANREAPTIPLTLPGSSVKWFNPSSGTWTDGKYLPAGEHHLSAPSGGDWVLLIQYL